MQIVLARLEEEQVIARQGRIDLGERHQFKTVYHPVACMWLNKGTTADVEKAKAFAAQEGYQVFCYDKIKDPLEQAKKDVETNKIID